ncbi:hypothetical protein Tco_1043376 [Tanacetum coccineum]|uniref:Uncharacterized protein n=1 Tax=Tanacetum coccineum TaxID=301880 RepID=A0ABQ5GLU6_9ASTR
MLATDDMQRRSRFLRYIDTRPNGVCLLKGKFILEGPYTPSTVIIPAIPATDNSPAIPERITVETVLNMSPKNKAHFESEKESALKCKKLSKATTRAVNEMNKNNYDSCYECKSMFNFFNNFKQNGQEVNELCAERITKNANPLALVATAQSYQDPYYQAPRSHKSYAPTSKASLPTRSYETTRNKGKEIAKPITPPSESASEEDSNPEQAQKDKEMQKNLALIANYFKKIYKPTNNNLKTSFKH